MEKIKDCHGKRCKGCRRFFRPHPSAKSRQLYCGRGGCPGVRKRTSQRAWVEKNPGCFGGRYEAVKEWRKCHPDYQRRWREKRRREIQDLVPPGSPVKSVRLVIPENLLRGEIQDLVLLVRRYGRGFWVAGVPGEIQDELARKSATAVT